MIVANFEQFFLKVIKPAFFNTNNARDSLVASLGKEIVAPLGNFFILLYLFEYNLIGAIKVLPIETIVPLFALFQASRNAWCWKAFKSISPFCRALFG